MIDCDQSEHSFAVDPVELIGAVGETQNALTKLERILNHPDTNLRSALEDDGLAPENLPKSHDELVKKLIEAVKVCVHINTLKWYTSC